MFASKTTIIVTAVAALFTASNAAVVNLYSDTACKTPAGSRNVYDNTCAPLGGFQSFKITTAGGSGQQLTAWSPNDCGGTYTACEDAQTLNVCYEASDSSGGSNAMSSSPVCGTV